ncbi:MAG: MBL fold metallo-hydrolase [Clostridia bacterium]|nr:MBL fold metallo-hydrolase [Clostridia bacterium]
MKLTILGKYGPFPPVNGATSGYLLQSDNANAVIDCGSGTLNRLKGKIKVEDIDFIVLSHLHFDHISDMGVLSYALAFSKKKEKVNVYLPAFECKALETLKSMAEFNLIFIEENKVYYEKDLEFSFYKMTHPVLSYGVKISSGEKTFAYTGDTTVNCNIRNLVSNANVVLCDGAFLQEDYLETKPHMSVIQAVEVEKLFGGKVIVTHVGEGYKDSQVESEIKSVSQTAELAIEGKTYSI